MGNGEAIGFYASDDLITKRQIALLEQSNLVKEGHNASHQSERGPRGTCPPVRQPATPTIGGGDSHAGAIPLLKVV